MPRLLSKSALIKWTKSQLGAPTINIEVTTTQMSEIIDDAVQKFSEYAYGTLEDTVLVQLNGANEYALPDTITNIIKVSKGGGSGSDVLNFGANFGGGFVPNVWSDQFFSGSGSFLGDLIPTIISISNMKSQLEKYLSDDVYYNFNHLSKKLQVLEAYSGVVAIHYQYEYIADENNDFIYNHEWIKLYTKAKVKELWGTVTGKFDQALVGGARINYDRMLTEAQEEIRTLDEQLLTKWSDPAPIDVA